MPVSYAAPSQRQLTDLPVELLTELYLVALSPSLPLVCKHIYTTIKSFPPSVHAQYIYGREPPSLTQAKPTGAVTQIESAIAKVKHTVADDKPALHIASNVITRALRYPICVAPVLDAMLRLASRTCKQIGTYDARRVTLRPFELPKRLFRALDDTGALGPDSDPLPLLRFLWDNHEGNDAHSYTSTHTGTPVRLPKPCPNSHGGYPLVRAVHAGFIPLIEFLLAHGADPGQHRCMAVQVAIGKRDLALVRMLVEFPPEGEAKKRRRRADRVTVDPFMVDLAVRCDARDIVQYFVQEKGCVPSMRTLRGI